MSLARKYSKYNVSQQFVEMLQLQNKPWLVTHKKIRAMSFLPSVECGKFKLKKAFQSDKSLACTNKSELCATQADYNDAKMPGSASLFHMHPLLLSDYAILTYILSFFLLCAVAQRGDMAQSPPLNVHVLMVTAY